MSQRWLLLLSLLPGLAWANEPLPEGMSPDNPLLQQCFNVVGNKVFCDCINDEFGYDFVEYTMLTVTIPAIVKDKIRYDTLNNDVKKQLDTRINEAHSARESCAAKAFTK